MKLLTALLCLVASTASIQDDPAVLVAQLEAVGPVERSTAWDRLVALGPPSCEAATVGFERATAPGRRARAALLREVGGADWIAFAAARCADPDTNVRENLLAYLARPDHGVSEIELRIAAFEARARVDMEGSVRDIAMRALGELDEERAVASLARLMRELPWPERTRAATHLPVTARSWEAVSELVRAGFHAPGRELYRTPDDLLAALLPLYGRLLADRPGGGEHAADRAPLILGLRHPSTLVQIGAGDAFDRLLIRVRELDETERGMRMLDGLEEQGLDHRLVHYHRARMAFWPGGNATAALSAALEMRSAGPPGDDILDRIWLYRSFQLQAGALVALGRAQESLNIYAEAAAVLDGILAERHDLHDNAHADQHIEALEQRAIVEASLAVARIAAGTPADERKLLGGLRRAHLYALEAQLVSTRNGGNGVASWDTLFSGDLSPYRILFTGTPLEALPLPRALELQGQLGRALATIAPFEAPGFEPFAVTEELSDPVLDPQRFQILHDLYVAQLERVSEDLISVLGRIARRQAMGQDVSLEDETLRNLLERQRQWMQVRLNDMEVSGYEDLYGQRVPSELGLWYARDLRTEGRATDARKVAERMQNDLDETRAFLRLPWAMEAQIEMIIGNSWTDEDDPRRAQEELERAVERLEEVEVRMVEQGATRQQLAGVRSTRCSALVSLAVNANVKLGDGDRALEYFEQAFELRQDDFMRVLLACYRARSGRDAEARALVRELRPSPAVTYNMACTYALLGEKQKALDYLEIELNENHNSEASRKRQMEWAQGDPDLAALRDDPRFEVLVGLR